MPKLIVWSRMAELDFSLVTDYLLTNWTAEIANAFADLVDHQTAFISDHPRSYPLINKKQKVRKCVITKHNSLYYRENDDHVEILRLFDNRQNPVKLKFGP